MKTITRPLILGGLALRVALGTTFSQTPAECELLKKKYQGEQAVIINDKEDIVIDVDKNKEAFRINESIIKETLLLQPPTNDLATDKVYSSMFNIIKSIDAKTLVPERKKFKAIKVEKFVDQKSPSDYVFYDESVAKNFVYPAVQTGAITSLKYTQEIINPYLLGAFYFKWHLPCEISRISIKADKRANLKYKLYNAESTNLEFSRQEKGNYSIYTWTAKNIPAANFEADAPNIKYYFPHVVFYIDNSSPSDTTNKKNNGLNGLYRYYYGLVKNINTNDDPAVRSEVDKIIAGAVSEEEKVKRLFYWVQENINYIAFEDGMQGFIPEPGAQVFKKRYGDCKGMSSVLNYMLKMAGIKSYLTWIGTRHLPYRYTDIPSEVVDNHMIVTYYQNGKPIFLDATNNYLAFGLPSSMIQGKQALVGIDENTYKVEEVPVLKSNENVISDTTNFYINNHKIEGSGNICLTGYEKVDQAYSLDGKDKIKTRDHLLGMVAKGNNKFFLDTFTIENLSNREVPLKINYKYKLNDYFKEIDGEIYLNMNLTKILHNATLDTAKRTCPLENDNYSQYRSIAIFEIPQGYQVSYLPKNRSGSFDKLAYKISYTIEHNKVIQNKEIIREFLILKPGEFKKWNEVVESLNRAYRDVLILKKIKS